jgi:hypothetical protein
MIAVPATNLRPLSAPLTDHSHGILHRAIQRSAKSGGPIDRLVVDQKGGLWKVRVLVLESCEVKATWKFVC